MITHRNRFLGSIPLLLTLLFYLSTNAIAQLTPEQAISRRQLSDVRISPNGQRICVVVSDPLTGTNRTRHIWLLDAVSHQLTKFTNSAKSEYSPRWSPDGKRLAFISDREDSPQIYLISISGGEAVRLTQGKNAIRSFEWSPDGKQIAFIAPEPKTEADEKKEKDKDDARVVDRDDKHPRLWLIDVESKKVRQLTTGRWQISEVQWAPQGDKLVVSATDKPESDENTNAILVVSSTDGALKELLRPRGPFGGIRVSPDGKSLIYSAARVDGPTPHDVYIVPIEGGVPRNLTGQSLDRPVFNVVWKTDGTLMATCLIGGNSQFCIIKQTGEVTKIQPTKAAPHPTSFDFRGGRLAFVAEDTINAPEIYTDPVVNSEGERDVYPQKYSHFNDDWARVPVIKPEIVRYKSFDGMEIEALLLKPRNYVEGTKVPTVVLVHGGPTGAWTDSFDSWGQILAARGYAVFYPNIRGSIGFGHRFLEMNRGDWGGGDFKDVMAGVDFLISRGIADPYKLGIGGWSYGGYMAAWAITQTNRFKAAVSGAGMSDLATEFGTEDGPAYDEWFYGLPYEKPEGFAKSSPMTFIKNARTPTLILHGENDRTDPIGQSQMLYRALKRYGVESEFVVYPREPHGLQEEKHLIDRLNRIVRWFDAHLK
jgi:dipeptidyl aminopeptidase/acylaminoacyl peptidase